MQNARVLVSMVLAIGLAAVQPAIAEHKDWATFDVINAKTEEISKKVYAGEEKRVQLMVKRADMREMLGLKNMQEVTFR